MAAHHQHENHGHHGEGKSDLMVGLSGLGIGLVFVFCVAAFAHWLAL